MDIGILGAGIGERFGIVPVSKNVAYWAGAIATNSIKKSAQSRYKTELTNIFTRWPDPIVKIINETPSNRINRILVHDHDPIDVWHKNNVILLGDAAHSALPTSGQGACQALENAWHLSQAIKTFNSNTSEAFTSYTKKRLNKTTAITMSGRQLASSLFNKIKTSANKEIETANTPIIPVL